MYEENENKIEWGQILKRIGMLLVVIVVILGIITLVTKCSKKDDKPKTETPTNINLENQLNELERATLQYLTKDNVPTELNASKTIRLKILINRGLVDNIKDEENNKCSADDSYSEITRLEGNYAVKMSLTCGKNKASRVIYVGCFEGCNGGICKGEENQVGGICGEITTPTDNGNQGIVTPSPIPNTNTNTNTNKKPSTNNNNNTNTNKPSNNNNNNNSNNSSSNNNTISKGTLYEYKKCSTSMTCDVGQMNANGQCDVYEHVTLIGTVVPGSAGTSYTTKNVPAEKKSVPSTSTKTETVYFKNSADAKANAKNTSNVTYKFVGIQSNGTYKYTKTTKTTTYKTVYYCNGKETSSSTCTVKVPATASLTPTCEDNSYTYNASTKQCTKVELRKTIVPSVVGKETCQTMWSYSTSIPGWTRTGRTK